jgi:hypothetical protein
MPRRPRSAASLGLRLGMIWIGSSFWMTPTWAVELGPDAQDERQEPAALLAALSLKEQRRRAATSPNAALVTAAVAGRVAR